MKLLLFIVLIHFNTAQLTGVVKFYNEDKGFGYITCNNEEYYVYDDGLIDEVKAKDRVSFDARNTRKGYEAINVRIIKK